MKKPLYLRLDNTTHEIIEKLIAMNYAANKTDLIEKALLQYLWQRIGEEEMGKFLANLKKHEMKRGDLS